MAMVDDTDWLLSHIQHSFITSDDTGMCEMVIQNNDLCTLDEHRERLRRQNDTEKQYTQNSTNDQNINVVRAPSPDITSGWDFGVRRRSNTAQKLERIRKERQSRVKVKTVHWKQMPQKFVGDHINTMFEKKDIAKNEVDLSDDDVSDGLDTETESQHLEKSDNGTSLNPTGTVKKALSSCADDIPVTHTLVASFKGFQVKESLISPVRNEPNKKLRSKSSALSKLLESSVEETNNPFKEYSKFDGRGHEGTTATQSINMFVHVYGEPVPKFSVCVVILISGAKIQDLIGLTCCRYYTEKVKPDLKRSDVQGYELHISEDDGEVDYGFPPLDSGEPVSKFSFPTLALVEKHPVSTEQDGEERYCESVFVKVNYRSCFSLIQVDDLSVTMGEILKKALKKRKGNKYSGVYKLEYQDRPGEVVDEDQTLDSTGVMEFCMIREHSVRINTAK